MVPRLLLLTLLALVAALSWLTGCAGTSSTGAQGESAPGQTVSQPEEQSPALAPLDTGIGKSQNENRSETKSASSREGVQTAPPAGGPAPGQAPPPGKTGGEHRNGNLPGVTQLLAEGTLTQEQADQIQTYLEAKMDAERKQMQTMTADERQDYFENNRTRQPELTKELVTAGIITQEQADKLKAAMPTPPQGSRVGSPSPSKTN